MSLRINSQILGTNFWQSYENCLVNHSINPSHYRWYKNWCQQFVKFIDPLPLADCQPEHVSAVLSNLRSRPAIKDWQYDQARAAFWILFRDLLQVLWALAAGQQVDLPITCRSRETPAQLSLTHQTTLQKLNSTLVGRQYAKRTVIAYLDWATRFLAFYPHRAIVDLDADSVKAYLTALAEVQHVAVNTQKQALNALVFLFQESEGRPLGDFSDFTRATKPIKVPTVLSRNEVSKLLGQLSPPHSLMANLLYGSGLRLLECLRLRIMDVDFELSQILVRDGKGRKDRITMLPEVCREPLRQQIADARLTHADDLSRDYGEVWLPSALAKKYPGAARDWRWR
jgi:integrase